MGTLIGVWLPELRLLFFGPVGGMHLHRVGVGFPEGQELLAFYANPASSRLLPFYTKLWSLIYTSSEFYTPKNASARCARHLPSHATARKAQKSHGDMSDTRQPNPPNQG